MTGVRKRIRLRRANRVEQKARKAMQRKLRREQWQKSIEYIQLQAECKAQRKAKKALIVSCYSLDNRTSNINGKIEEREGHKEARAKGNKGSREGSEERGRQILAKCYLAVLA
jgi:hypothetical protein